MLRETETSKRTPFRATESDLEQIARIADYLRSEGIPFPTRADAIRHALSTTASRVAPSVRGTDAND